MSQGPRRERPRHHRRVDAPPTNPEAERCDDVPDPRGGPPREPGQGDPRDDWIAEQRPPHWD